jgi:hypothetical protein
MMASSGESMARRPSRTVQTQGIIFFIRISKTWHVLKHVRSSYKKYLEKTEPLLLKQDCVRKI